MALEALLNLLPQFPPMAHTNANKDIRLIQKRMGRGTLSQKVENFKLLLRNKVIGNSLVIQRSNG